MFNLRFFGLSYLKELEICYRYHLHQGGLNAYTDLIEFKFLLKIKEIKQNFLPLGSQNLA